MSNENAAPIAPPVTAKLCTHRGSKRVTREQLDTLPIPKGTSTWTPVPHNVLIETLTEEFLSRGLFIESEEFAVQRQDNLLFGIFKLSSRSNAGDYRGAFGFRTSNDKTLALRAVAGINVFVCDNLALSGNQIVLHRKHTSRLAIRDEVHTAADRFLLEYKTLSNTVEDMKSFCISDDQAKVIIYEAFKTKLMPLHLFTDVDREYFEPSFEDFRNGSNMWRLNNAFTYAARDLNPLPKMESLTKVGAYFNSLMAI